MNARRIPGRHHGTPEPRYGVAGGVITQADLSGGTVTGADTPSSSFSLDEPSGWTMIYVGAAIAFLFVLFVRIK